MPSLSQILAAPPRPHPGTLANLTPNKDGKPARTRANLHRILTGDPLWSGKVKRNELSGDVEVTMPDGTDGGLDDATRWATVWCEHTYGLANLSASWVADALAEIARTTPYNPIADYLHGLPAWDGVDRCTRLIPDYFQGADTQLHRAFGVLFLTGAVGRALQPGCEMQEALVLSGPQGCGKSSGVEILAGRDHYMDTRLDLGSKDAYEQIRGRWIVELAEVDRYGPKQQPALKAFLSSRTDRYRKPYSRDTSDVPRTCAVVGTTNVQRFLSDATGSRRYLVAQVGIGQRVDLAALRRDRDQIWAQALAMYKLRGVVRPTATIMQAVVQANREHEFEGPIHTAVADYCLDRHFVEVTELWPVVGRGEMRHRDGSKQMTITDALVRLGYVEGRQRDLDGTRRRGWWHPEKLDAARRARAETDAQADRLQAILDEVSKVVPGALIFPMTPTDQPH